MNLELNLVPTWQRMNPANAIACMNLGAMAITKYSYAPSQNFPPSAAANYSMTYVSSGYATLNCYGQSIAVRQGDVVSFPAGYVQAIQVHDSGLVTFVLDMAQNERSRYPKIKFLFRHVGLLTADPLKSRFVEIVELYGQDRGEIRFAVENLLAEAEKQACVEFDVDDWPEMLRRRLHDGYQQQFQLIELADEFDMNPSHLTRQFRSRFGMTVGSYLRKLRLSLAVGQMLETDESFSGIAADCGFSDQSHLNRMLKSATGWSPYEIRKRFRQSTTAKIVESVAR